MTDAATSTAETTDSSSPGTPDKTLKALIDLVLIVIFATIISISAYVGAIPVGGQGVPITLQTFAVMLAGCVLGPWRGTAAVLLYLTLGLFLPVYAEHSTGPGVWTGISWGYLLSFPIAAFVGGALVKWVAGPKGKTHALAIFACSITASILVIHPLGILGMALHQDVSFMTAAAWDLPFWIGDLVKTSLVALIAAEVHRAFPNLLHPGSEN